jgi:tRNA pseudouridine55 synthase
VTPSPTGVLVVDKPLGMTSHDVVDVVRERFGAKKVGHAGTLDPNATGVLLLGLGRGTRFLSYAQASPKRYRTVAVFGVTTSTQDESGEVVKERRVADLSSARLTSALGEFIGEIEQVPPMVSAVKLGGERLYRKARRGEDVDRDARLVTVYEFDLVDLEVERARATLDVRCSAGTYVRTLVNDLGETLGCGAHVRDLRRTEAGGFTEEDAVPLAELSTDHLLPLASAVRELPSIEVDPDLVPAVRNGRLLPLVSDAVEGAGVALVRGGDLLAVYRRSGEKLVPDRVVGE